MTKLTVKDLFEKKGKVKLTELYVTNALEAHAAERAGIDFVHASYGYGNVKCEKSIQNPIELLKLLD